MTCGRHTLFSDIDCPSCNSAALQDEIRRSTAATKAAERAASAQAARAASQRNDSIAEQRRANELAQQQVRLQYAALEQQRRIALEQKHQHDRAMFSMWRQTPDGLRFLAWRDRAIAFARLLDRWDDRMQAAMSQDVENLNRMYPEPHPSQQPPAKGLIAQASRKLSAKRLDREWSGRRAAFVRQNMHIGDPNRHDGTSDDWVIWSTPNVRQLIRAVAEYLDEAVETRPTPETYPALSVPKAFRVQEHSLLGAEIWKYRNEIEGQVRGIVSS